MDGAVTIRDEQIPISSNQLFMRIVCVMKNDTDKSEYFRYELAPRPPALFDGTCMRKTDKSSFATLFVHKAPEATLCLANFVIDGGYLLHATATWPRPSKYGEICELYVKHILQRYSSSTVVFDGYSGSPSTKGEEQRRRAAKKFCPDIVFNDQTVVTVSQTDFLSNGKNKARLIEMLKGRFWCVGATSNR